MSDFYGIELIGSIKVPNKDKTTNQVYQLWTGNTFSDPNVPVALQDLAYVQDISIQIGLAMNSKVTLTLTPPLEEGLALIHSPLLNWGGSMLEVQIGYSTGGPLGTGLTGTDMTFQSFGGLVMKPDVRIGQDVVITINALGVAYGMNLSHMTTKRTYPPGTSPWQAVRQTFVDLGYDSASDESKVFGSDLPAEIRNPDSPKAHPFFKPVTRSSRTLVNVPNFLPSFGTQSKDWISFDKGPRNDWWFVRETIKNYNLDMFIVDQQVKIRDPQAWKMDKPKYKFVMQGNLDTDVNSDSRIYPILEFNTPSAYVWLANGSGGLLLSDVSADTKKELQAVITSTKSASTRDPSTQNPVQSATPQNQNPLSSLGNQAVQSIGGAIKAVGGAAAKTFFGDATVKIPPIDLTRTASGGVDASGSSNDAASTFPGSPEDAAADQAIAEYKNYNHSRGIQAEITSLGIPELLPAMVIYVDGMAPVGTPEEKAWFDGLYGIMMVEHNIGTSGMTTKFKALKNFIPSDMQGATDNVAGDVNSSGDIQDSSSGSIVNPDTTGQ